MHINEHNCNNLQTLNYINVAGTVNPRLGSGWCAWFWQSNVKWAFVIWTQVTDYFHLGDAVMY